MTRIEATAIPLLPIEHSKVTRSSNSISSMNAEEKKPKRKRSNNPLASARKNDKVESLWHRKSGAAFRLFVEFYASQPIGVCSGGEVTTNDVALLTSSSEPTAVGHGQSRASKRRKRKTCQHGGDASGSSSTPETADAAANTALANEEEYIDLRLLRALRDFEGGCSHLQTFVTSLAKPLPLTFRIRRTVFEEQQTQVKTTLREEYGHLVEESPFDPLIYQAKSVSLSKATLSKVSPALKQFLVTNSLNGTLARQELASMLPVLALFHVGSLANNGRVLDVCAAPGSKTLQALEIVGSSGRVKANDVNERRLESLREAIERAGLLTSHRVKYSNLDASKYPIPSSDKRLFDTILCDVPCCGDGTIRKDPHVLANWTPATSNALHALQVNILVRSLQCLRVGGIMSYSTCSLNPVENEAVVAAALVKARGMFRGKHGVKDGPPVELVPWPKIEGLKCHPGVKDWKIADYVGDTDEDDEDMVRLRWHPTYEDSVAAGMKNALSSMWPPSDADSFHFDRCIRLWPQDHDSGGFFVALIRRNW
jgi:16S rRNA C967 or C1407 C5-methylase (RsmB/RsmF family)